MTKIRRQRGGAIAETGPALYIFLIVILFPLFDLLGISSQFLCSWYLNHECVRELSVTKSPDFLNALTYVQDKFNNTGMIKFVHMSKITQTYTTTPQSSGTDGSIATVTLVTNVKAAPFLKMWTLGVGVPGLSEDLNLTFGSTRPWEAADATLDTAPVTATKVTL